MYISPVAFCSACTWFGAGPHPCSSLGEPAGRRGRASLDTRSSSLRRCFTPYLTLMMQCSRSCGVRWLMEEWRMHFLDSRGLSQVREARSYSLLSIWCSYGWQEWLPSLWGWGVGEGRTGLLCFQPEVAKDSSATDPSSKL